MLLDAQLVRAEHICPSQDGHRDGAARAVLPGTRWNTGTSGTPCCPTWPVPKYRGHFHHCRGLIQPCSSQNNPPAALPYQILVGAVTARAALWGPWCSTSDSGGGSVPGRIAHPGCCQPRGHHVSGRPHIRWTPLGWPSRCRQPTSPAGREAHN